MGEGLLLAVEVPCHSLHSGNGVHQGCGGWNHGVVTDCGMSAVCVDFPATVVTQKKLPQHFWILSHSQAVN